AAPVILPDGSVVYGSRTLYNGFRGHLMKFSRTGLYQGNYDFGWDITPGIYRHDGTYSMITKDNLYVTNGPLNVTSLDANLHKQQAFTNTETKTCVVLGDGRVVCSDDSQHRN